MTISKWVIIERGGFLVVGANGRFDEMNWEKLKKNVGARVQLDPIACRLDEMDRELPSVDYDWIILEVTDTEICILNEVTGHRVLLGTDHIHHFTTNPKRRSGGNNYGFLTLLVQVFLRGNDYSLRPNARPGEPVKPQRSEIVEKCVDFGYPAAAGILQRLKAAGYKATWCWETRLARLVDIEGWEVVVEPDKTGVLTRFRVKDGPADQILIKIKETNVKQQTPQTNIKRCTECRQELYLAKRGNTPLDTVWLCPNQTCPSNRNFR